MKIIVWYPAMLHSLVSHPPATNTTAHITAKKSKVLKLAMHQTTRLPDMKRVAQKVLLENGGIVAVIINQEDNAELN